MIVREVAAYAWLADPGCEPDDARERAAAGDPDWEQWTRDLDGGRATLIDLRVTVALELDDGSLHTVEAESHGIWIELTVHPPVLAATIAEIGSQDFPALAREIETLGESLTVRELDDMHVNVTLAPDLQAALRPHTDPDDGY